MVIQEELIVKTLRATKQQWQEIENAAKQAGMPLATFVRVAALRAARIENQKGD